MLIIIIRNSIKHQLSFELLKKKVAFPANDDLQPNCQININYKYLNII